ncbi:FtsB family cell division protein [Candidatus Weimeria sp. HCP3S3_B5]|uniref:FtsB family cell division protein n=1 Tax=Candidatus Weimeria sp. HCP3S3_B5 TaxID=3438871 RepID=UPI002A94F825|nr:septum formation initiator family protein [Lachnospiraceae bacterium]
MTVVQGTVNSRQITAKRRRTRRGIVFILFAVILVTLLCQLRSLYGKYRTYRVREATVKEQIAAAKEKQQDLKDYEKYTKTREYTESTARSKLGLLYDNEKIFKEK